MNFTPKKREKSDHKILTFRCSPDEQAILDQIAESHNLNRSEALRSLIYSAAESLKIA